MKIVKKTLALILVLTMVVAFASPMASAKGATKIGVALYQDSGAAVTAVKSYLDSLKDTLNVEYQYVVLSTNDENYNLSKIQELIGADCEGIICTMDSGMDAILNECADAGVYLAGYLSDYDDSFRNNYSGVFENEYFLGTVADGGCADEARRGYDFFDSVIEYNERTPDAPIRHVAMTAFPAWAFPYQQSFIAQFNEKVEEYNAANPDKAIEVDPFNEETDTLMFKPMDSTYFTKHPGIDAIVSVCAGSFVYPTMVSAGVSNTMKLFAAGYNDGDEAVFGSKGAYQMEIVSPVEAITYPLVLLLNKINGAEYPDQPAVAERKGVSVLLINSDEDLAKFQKSIYLSFKPEDAFLTPDEVLALTAYANPDATYAGLCDILDHMSIEDIK
jgi:ABC-type sugar transport system substrate-binding protein